MGKYREQMETKVARLEIITDLLDYVENQKEWRRPSRWDTETDTDIPIPESEWTNTQKARMDALDEITVALEKLIK